MSAHRSPALHHVELWTADLDGLAPALDWLLGALGWQARTVEGWPEGRTWHHADGTYLVLEQSPTVRGTDHDRLRPGLNHLALRLPPGTDARSRLDAVRAGAAAHGWSELFTERYPHAGGPQHTALFLEHPQGFEIEVVATVG